MPIVHLIRHAKATGRDDWPGDDRERPLSPRGYRQAELLAEAYEDPTPGRVLCSPARRCIETVTPLADRFGMTLDVEDWCFEGRRLVLPQDTSTLVLCAHGDNIPDLLGRLQLQWYKCAQASTWRLEFDDAWAVAGSAYIEPPDKS